MIDVRLLCKPYICLQPEKQNLFWSMCSIAHITSAVSKYCTYTIAKLIKNKIQVSVNLTATSSSAKQPI